MARQLVRITVDLSPDRAAALALFIKRLMLADCETKCSAGERAEALGNTMQSAPFDVANALADAGFAPR